MVCANVIRDQSVARDKRYLLAYLCVDRLLGGCRPDVSRGVPHLVGRDWHFSGCLAFVLRTVVVPLAPVLAGDTWEVSVFQ